MKQHSDNWEKGDLYEQYIGRWSRQLAPQFLAWLGFPKNRRWLDVGCGTGALSAAILEHCAPASVTGLEPSEGFLNRAKIQLTGRTDFLRGQAGAIPLAKASVDATVSGLVLNFIPNQDAALAEMSRVTMNGGSVCAYVWDYAGKMELMRYFWDAVVELDPESAGMDEGIRFPICNPITLAGLFESSGLKAVEVTAIDLSTHFSSFDDFWNPFLGGQGPAPAYVMALDEVKRARLRNHLRQRIPVQEDGSIRLTSRAWAIRSTVIK